MIVLCVFNVKCTLKKMVGGTKVEKDGRWYQSLKANLRGQQVLCCALVINCIVCKNETSLMCARECPAY